MKRHLLLFCGAGLVGAGLVGVAVGLLLWEWEHSAGAHRDIAARGPWIVGVLIPYLIVGAAIITLGLAAMLSRGGPIRLWARVALPLLAVPLGFVLLTSSMALLQMAGLVWPLWPWSAIAVNLLLSLSGLVLLRRACARQASALTG